MHEDVPQWVEPYWFAVGFMTGYEAHFGDGTFNYWNHYVVYSEYSQSAYEGHTLGAAWAIQVSKPEYTYRAWMGS